MSINRNREGMQPSTPPPPTPGINYLAEDPNSALPLLHSGETHAQPKIVTSLSAAVFNLTNAILGAGVLALPYCLKILGLTFGIIMIVIVAFLANYAYFLLHRCSLETKQNSYSRVALKTCGPWLCVTLDVIQAVYSFGVLVAYLIVIGDTMKPIFEEFTDFSVSTNDLRTILLVIVTYCILLPLSLLPTMDYLKHSSLAAIICVIFITFMVVGKSTEYIDNNDIKDIKQFDMSLDFFIALPIVLFAYNCSTQMIPIYSELHKPTSDIVANQLVRYSLAICFFVYTTVASFGYIQFGDDTEDNILSNYDNDDTVAAIGRVSLSTVITFSYPIIYQPLKHSVDQLYHLHKSGDAWMILQKSLENEDVLHFPPFPRHIVFLEGLFIISLSLIVAIFAPSLTQVFALTGAVGAPTMCYIFPGMMYLKLIPPEDRKARTWPTALVIFGGVSFVLSVTITLLDISGVTW